MHPCMYAATGRHGARMDAAFAPLLSDPSSTLLELVNGCCAASLSSCLTGAAPDEAEKEAETDEGFDTKTEVET